MNSEQKAKELLDKFKKHVNPYIGSGMLSNTHDDDAILWQSKACAIIAVDEIIEAISEHTEFGDDPLVYFWEAVKKEIDKL